MKRTKNVFAFSVAILCVGLCVAFAGAVLFTPTSAVDSRFAGADSNRDGKLNQQEFEQYLAKLNQMKMVKKSESAPAGECDFKNKNETYAREGSYIESALGYSYVPVKSVTETDVTEIEGTENVKSKSGGCCGGKKKEMTSMSSEKSGGCCGGKKKE
jgi:hypothetical protein